MRVVHVLRKPPETTVSRNVLDHGCGGLHIDAARIKTTEDTTRTLGDTAYQLRKGASGSVVTSGQGEAVDGSYARRSHPDREVITNYLDTALKDKGMSKADLARATGLGTTVYSWWDKSRNRLPTPEQWPTIKKALDLDNTHDQAMTEMVWVPRRGTNEGSKGSGGRFPSNMILRHLPGCRKEAGQWECVSGCPATALDEETGMQRGWDKHGIYGSSGDTLATCYADEGGASRFFKQVGSSNSWIA